MSILRKNAEYYKTKKLSLLLKDTVKVSVSNKISSGKKYYKYFIVYLDNDHKVSHYK